MDAYFDAGRFGSVECKINGRVERPLKAAVNGLASRGAASIAVESGVERGAARSRASREADHDDADASASQLGHLFSERGGVAARVEAARRKKRRRRVGRRARGGCGRAIVIVWVLVVRRVPIQILVVVNLGMTKGEVEESVHGGAGWEGGVQVQPCQQVVQLLDWYERSDCFILVTLDQHFF